MKRKNQDDSETVQAAIAQTTLPKRTIIITGANRGIGLEFTKRYISKGWNVIAASRSPDSIPLASLPGLYKSVHLDMSSLESISAFAQSIGAQTPINLLINNAGILPCPSHESNLQTLSTDMIYAFKVNAMGPHLLSLSLHKNLCLASTASNPSVVVNVTSRMGSIDDNTSGSYHAYRASKTALNSLTRSLAIDWVDDGISVVLVHPGYVKTGMSPGGIVSTKESVDGMVRVIERAGQSEGGMSGKFYHFEGNELPW
ncbi:UNVERIFIED_CONTAM: hypothetical protein HDU68_010998 [Siphonaria sp. JEL0065]|nr:hypothetical protein HDU68_010998 [Siphonaria sp. JEL0065]